MGSVTTVANSPVNTLFPWEWRDVNVPGGPESVSISGLHFSYVLIARLTRISHCSLITIYILQHALLSLLQSSVMSNYMLSTTVTHFALQTSLIQWTNYPGPIGECEWQHFPYIFTYLLCVKNMWKTLRIPTINTGITKE